MFRCALAALLGVLLVGVAEAYPVVAGAAPKPTPTTSTTLPPAPAVAELLVDVGTGKVLLAHNDHLPLPPGSLTKMLTAMIAVDWLKAGAQVPVTALAANATPDRIGMKAGQVWTFNATIRSLLIFSANDAAYALAQRVSGSLAAFSQTMQYAAAQIGMSDHPVLRDPAGLDGTEGYGRGNRISAWDVATAARDLMANPELAGIVATKMLDFRGPDGTIYGLRNQNLFFLNTYPGAIGVKTGLTDAAGFCVVEEAKRGARRMMAVVLNGTNSYQTAAWLLNKGFATPLAAEKANDPILPAIAEPEPPPLPTFRRIDIDDETATPAGAPIAAPATAHVQPVAASYGIEAAAGVLMVATVIVIGRRVLRRRPAGIHSRRADA